MLFVPAGIAITTQPSPTNQLVGTGQSISYSVTASGSPLNYQWQHNGSPLPNATNSTFTIASAQPSDSGNYDVLVTNNFYAVTSIVVSVTVTNLAIITQPVSVAAGYAGTATFSVVAVGAQPLFYQWYQNGSPIAERHEQHIDPLAVDLHRRGNYCVVVSNSLDSLTSAAGDRSRSRGRTSR